MKHLLPILLFLSAPELGMMLPTNAQVQPQSKRITPKALAKQLTETPQKLLILDVRSEDEFKQAHLPGAIHIPLDKLQSDQSLQQLKTQLKARQLVTYCHSGVRSRLALIKLHSIGIQGLDLEGGIVEWRKQIDPKMPEP